MEDGMDHPLTPAEAARLDELESIIAPRLQSWIEVGLALLEIRDARLYRATHTTFDDYCRERWGMARSRAYQLIAAAPIAQRLDDPSISEGVIRSINHLTPDQAEVVWRVVQQTAPDGRVTSRHLKAVVQVLGDVLVTGAVDDGNGGQIPIAQATTQHLKAAITETAYEAMMRQQQRLIEAQQPTITCQITITPQIIAALPPDDQATLLPYLGSTAKLIIKKKT